MRLDHRRRRTRGITAAAVALDQRLKTLIISEQWGGQTVYAMQLKSVEGRETLNGETLLDAFRRQLDYLDSVRRFGTATQVTPEERRFIVHTARGDCLEGRTLIIAKGTKAAISAYHYLLMHCKRCAAGAVMHWRCLTRSEPSTRQPCR